MADMLQRREFERQKKQPGVDFTIKKPVSEVYTKYRQNIFNEPEKGDKQ
jgi:hypothetical protein